MTADDSLSKPISFEELQQFKILEPLPPDAVAELQKIEKLEVEGFYEQEIRTFVIDPIIRILGYDKGTDFSADLGRSIEFLGKKKFPDYQFNLWQENFWLIEAKRPREGLAEFDYDDLAQAIEYAVHPKINAALVVLCDGLKIEIFDREVSVTEPVLHVDKQNLSRDFDKIRSLLEPIQAWFFQKRRVVRLIDKVFNKEFNLQRVEEFKGLIERRLSSKRGVILENYRRNFKSDTGEHRDYITNAPTEELVAVQMFSENSHLITNSLIETLVSRCEPNSFRVIYQIFRDQPRDSNDPFMAQAMMFLVALSQRQKKVPMLPTWLVPKSEERGDVEAAARYLLKQCLTTFESDEPRKVIQLAAATLKRIFKLFILSNEAQWSMGEVLHFVGRYQLPELSWGQIVSSPEGQLIGRMNGVALTAASHFVNKCMPDRGAFKTEVAKMQLKELWSLEKALLRSVGNYPKLRKERDLGDMQMVEWSNVSYDNLGHLSLCLLHGFPDWTAFALSTYHSEIETLASMGSWKARELIGIPPEEKVMISNQALADRFFFGDLATLETLQQGYS